MSRVRWVLPLLVILLTLAACAVPQPAAAPAATARPVAMPSTTQMATAVAKDVARDLASDVIPLKYQEKALWFALGAVVMLILTWIF